MLSHPTRAAPLAAAALMAAETAPSVLVAIAAAVAAAAAFPAASLRMQHSHTSQEDLARLMAMSYRHDLAYAAAVAVFGVPRTVGELIRLFSAEEAELLVSVVEVEEPCRRRRLVAPASSACRLRLRCSQCRTGEGEQ